MQILLGDPTYLCLAEPQERGLVSGGTRVNPYRLHTSPFFSVEVKRYLA